MNTDENAKLMFAARRAWGDWLANFTWDYFVTLTFTYEPSSESALREFKRWIRRIEQRARRGFTWFYALERGGSDLLHFHVLLSGLSDLSTSEIKTAWRGGRIHIAAYDQSKKGTQYVTKGLVSENLEYDLNVC